MKWISVEERLPEYGQHIILAIIYHGWNESNGDYKTKTITDGVREKTNILGENYLLAPESYVYSHKKQYDRIFKQGQVTHWMPLPPYPTTERGR